MVNYKKLFLPIFLIFNISMACKNYFSSRTVSVSRTSPASVEITVTPAPGTSADLSQNPGRIYVSNRNNQQKPPQLVLKISGLPPGTSVYWAFKYREGPHRLNHAPQDFFFSDSQNHPLNRWNDSTITDQNGESEIVFTATTYAGDVFQFGIVLKEYIGAFDHEDRMSIRFRNSFKKTIPFVVWKKIFFEDPKILKNIRFPADTWNWVKQNLERLNIECVGPLKPAELNPADPRIYYYFYHQKKDPLRGKQNNSRYGPEGYGPMEVMLSRLNVIFSDNDPKTINIFIFGASSKNRDLIHNGSPHHNPAPQPVDYSHFYEKGQIDLNEWSAFGTGRSMAGTSPAIFIWSDFWWLASKIIKSDHAKSLARVILHELGHQLLMFKQGGDEGILDNTGHLDLPHIAGKSVMTGSSITRLNRRGKPYSSSASMRLERSFINNPTWHPKIEMLIRRDYLPPEE